MNSLNFIQKYIKKVFPVIVILLIIVIAIVSSWLSQSSKNTIIIPSDRPQSNTSYDVLEEEDKQLISKDFLVGKLQDKLPYKGTYFTLEYNIASNKFIAVLSKKDKDKADYEFNQFLKDNSVEDKSWIRNLNLSYK